MCAVCALCLLLTISDVLCSFAVFCCCVVVLVALLFAVWFVVMLLGFSLQLSVLFCSVCSCV